MGSRLELRVRILISALIILLVLSNSSRSEELSSQNSMIQHPESYIKILDWSFLCCLGWGGNHSQCGDRKYQQYWIQRYKGEGKLLFYNGLELWCASRAGDRNFTRHIAA